MITGTLRAYRHLLTRTPQEGPAKRMTSITDTEAALNDLANAIWRQASALQFTTERNLQESLAELFRSEKYAAEREKTLGSGDRPDFMTDGGIAGGRR